MSEYQYIAFRAIDKPLTDRELTFAERQSTRAEITRWSFTNEYHFGDFRGNVDGLLRHGYDAHLHYANFGVRKIAFRFPAGLSFAKAVWSKYVRTGECQWKKDRKGQGGILTVDPSHDAGEIEEIWSPGDYMDTVAEVRNRLDAGDVRALYVLWLCAASDGYSDPHDLIEPPVPSGLAEFTDAGAALLEFFGLDPLMLVAASEGVPMAPPQRDQEQQVVSWIANLSEGESKQHLRMLLVEDATTVKAQLIAAIRRSGAPSGWPTVSKGRSFCDLLDRTEALRTEQEAQERKKREARARREVAKQERERQNRMTKMVNDPQRWLREAEKLVDARGTSNYEAAAEILADLREAISDDEGERITRMHAAHLAKKHPTLNRLKSSLRIYAYRTAGSDRDHRNTGGDSDSRGKQSTRQRACQAIDQ